MPIKYDTWYCREHGHAWDGTHANLASGETEQCPKCGTVVQRMPDGALRYTYPSDYAEVMRQPWPPSLSGVRRVHGRHRWWPFGGGR